MYIILPNVDPSYNRKKKSLINIPNLIRKIEKKAAHTG